MDGKRGQGAQKGLKARLRVVKTMQSIQNLIYNNVHLKLHKVINQYDLSKKKKVYYNLVNK